jgi:hypothetical protein
VEKLNLGRVFYNYTSLQIPEYLLLHCKHYAKERRMLAKALHKPRLSYHSSSIPLKEALHC